MVLMSLAWTAWAAWAWAWLGGGARGDVSATGYFFVTGPEYQNCLPRLALNQYKVTTHPAQAEVTQEAVLGCSRRCETDPQCTSFLLQPASRACHLTSLDRCLAPTNILVASPGYYYYEKFVNRTSTPHTCYDTCINTLSCQQCGRPSCWGPSCEQCPTYCWNTNSPTSGRLLLWAFDMTVIYWATCENQWQHWWSKGQGSMRDTPAGDHKLRLSVVLNGGQKLESHFDSVSVVGGNKLSVGNFIGGEAGNWWQAPFQSRNLFYNASLNCLRFFNPPGECDCPTCMSVEDQNSTYGAVQDRGFGWLITDSNGTALPVANILLWVTTKP